MGYWIHIYVGSRVPKWDTFPSGVTLGNSLAMHLQMSWLWQLTQTLLQTPVDSPVYVTVLLTKTVCFTSQVGHIHFDDDHSLLPIFTNLNRCVYLTRDMSNFRK